jgi:hypothetical protein
MLPLADIIDEQRQLLVGVGVLLMPLGFWGAILACIFYCRGALKTARPWQALAIWCVRIVRAGRNKYDPSSAIRIPFRRLPFGS